jgi:hypothetical protein
LCLYSQTTLRASELMMMMVFMVILLRRVA